MYAHACSECTECYCVGLVLGRLLDLMIPNPTINRVFSCICWLESVASKQHDLDTTSFEIIGGIRGSKNGVHVFSGIWSNVCSHMYRFCCRIMTATRRMRDCHHQDLSSVFRMSPRFGGTVNECYLAVFWWINQIARLLGQPHRLTGLVPVSSVASTLLQTSQITTAWYLYRKLSQQYR